MKKYLGTALDAWASAIALRIADEWNGNTPENTEDFSLLCNALDRALNKSPEECVKLIGTTIIEESYFDSI